jgi:hypothetical protein
MMKRVLMIAMVLLLAGSTQAAVSTFFGEDLGLGESTPLPSWPNASAAEAAFMSNLSGVGTESFEGMTTGVAPSILTFPVPGGTITATFSGGMTVEAVTPGTTNGVGRYATDGSQYLEGSTQSFSITFSDPVAAFGFYGIDIGDFSGQVTLTTFDGGSTLYTIPHTIDGAGGSVLFFGVIDTTNLYTMVTFGNTGAGVDYFGFDEMTVGTLEQVHPTVPVPGAILLGGIGTGLVSWLRRRRSL